MARTGWNGVVIRMSVDGSSLSTSVRAGIHAKWWCCMAASLCTALLSTQDDALRWQPASMAVNQRMCCAEQSGYRAYRCRALPSCPW